MSISKASRPESQPRLSNYLTVLAGEVAGEVVRFKRASTEAHRAYLAAGAKLVEARGECSKRGEWGVFLQAAGVSGAVARNMMQLTRAGLSAEDLTEAGGVQAALDALRKAAREAVETASRGLDDAGDEAQLNCAISAPDEGGEPSVPDRETARIPDDLEERRAKVRAEHEADRERIRREIEEDAASVKRVLDRERFRPASAPAPIPGPDVPYLDTNVWPGEPAADRLRRLRAERRAAGRCADCADWSGDAYRCDGCARKRATSNERAASRRRIGRALEGQIRTAAARGKGVRLSADDVRKLVDGEGAAFRERLARVGKGGAS